MKAARRRHFRGMAFLAHDSRGFSLLFGMFGLAACSGASERPIIPTTDPSPATSPPSGSGAGDPTSPGGPSGGAPETPAEPDQGNACNYESVDDWVVDCNVGSPASAVPKRLVQLDSATCADAYLLAGTKYDSKAQALAALSCNASCLRTPFQAAMLIRCGKKTEFVRYRADGCAEVFSTPDGLFRSLEEWDVAAPCP
jgi:hypothetical protein